MMPRFQPGDYDEHGEPRRPKNPVGEDEIDIEPDPRPVGPVRVSGMAIASLVCGVAGIIPIIVPSLLATVFGLIAMRDTRRREVAGRGMAVAGLWLGILGIAGWGALWY